jgi:subtilase family serine protease
MNRRRHGSPSFRPRAEVLDDRCLLSGLTPAQITHAYGLDAITFSGGTVKGDGTGETIALVEAYNDPYLASDLKAFDARLGLPDPTLSVVDLGGGPANDNWANEAMLDVEWAHAIAPGANILVVEAQSESVGDLMAAVNVARNAPGVAVVSMSWGFSEFTGETQYDAVFTTPMGHQGVTFFTASGDNGVSGGAEWPSSSPNVVSVGGTTLRLDASGAIGSETAWINAGGGYSSFENEPAYQQSAQTSGVRSTPDVTFDADPATAVVVYVTEPSTGVGGWQTIGGTSLGTPAWAAIVAIADQGLALSGKTSLDGATQTLPALYGFGAGNWGDFKAVSPGFGGGRFFPPGGQLATNASAYSTVSTGLGSPNGMKLVTDLAATPYASPPNPGLPSTGTLITVPVTPTPPTITTGHKKKVHHPVKKKVKPVHHKKVTAKHHVTHAVLDAAIEDLGSR